MFGYFTQERFAEHFPIGGACEAQSIMYRMYSRNSAMRR